MMRAVARHLLVSGADAEPQMTPVPYLVPLPDRHTLKVKRPDSLLESAFGDLKEENIKFVIKASDLDLLSQWEMHGVAHTETQRRGRAGARLYCNNKTHISLAPYKCQLADVLKNAHAHR